MSFGTIRQQNLMDEPYMKAIVTLDEYQVILLRDNFTPDEYRSVMKYKGYTQRSLSERWDKSEAWISKIINNPARDPVWNDALRGLPFVRNS
jgi:hypothetical protein